MGIARFDIKPVFAERNIPVALATDENYLPYVKVLLRSIVANTKWNLDFLILGNSVPETAQTALKDAFAQCENVSIRFIDVANLVAGTAVEGFKSSWSHLTEASFHRLFLPQLLPCYDRLVYIDVDTVVCGDIAELYSTDIGDNLFCGAIDDGIALWPVNHPEYAKWLEMNSFSAKDLESYVNSGVLLMNLKAFREASLLDRLLSTALETDKHSGFCDQDALNFVCRGRIKILDASWDIMTGASKEMLQKQLSSMKEEPHLYHFTGKDKPWKDPSYLYSNVWWRYIDIEDGIALWRKIFNVSEDKTSGEGIAVSVIIPIYNAEKYLKQMLISLAAQTLRNIEIICVDDGSPDGSKAICEEFAAFDSRFRVITQKNSGAAVARNRGIEEAKGRWLYVCDADDFCKPEMLEEMVAEGEKKNADVVAAGRIIVDASRGSNSDNDCGVPQKYLDAGDVVNCHTEGINVFSGLGFAPWNKLYRRGFVIDTGLRFQDNPACDDVYFVLAAFLKAERIAFVGKSYYYYRSNLPTSQMGQADRHPTNFLKALLAVRDLVVDFEPSIQQDFFRVAIASSFANLFDRKTSQGRLVTFDAIRDGGFAALECPVVDVATAELGEWRPLFDMVRKGCDLTDLFDARYKMLNGDKTELRFALDKVQATAKLQKEKLTKAWSDQGVMKEKLNAAWETNKVNKEKLQAARDEIKELKTKLQKRETSLKKREREINSLKSSAAYRVGMFITWPIRKMRKANKQKS